MQDFGLPDPLINDKMTDISSIHICIMSGGVP